MFINLITNIIDEIISTNYSPTLSGLELKICCERTILDILTNLQAKYAIESTSLTQIIEQLTLITNKNEMKNNKNKDTNITEKKPSSFNSNIKPKHINSEKLNFLQSSSFSEESKLNSDLYLKEFELKKMRSIYLTDNSIACNNAKAEKDDFYSFNKIYNKEISSSITPKNISPTLVNNIKEFSQKFNSEEKIFKKYNLDTVAELNSLLYLDKNCSLSYKTEALNKSEKKNKTFIHYNNNINTKDEQTNLVVGENIDIEQIRKENSSLTENTFISYNHSSANSYFTYKINEKAVLIVDKCVMKIQYSEAKPYYIRKTLHEELKDLIDLIPRLKDIKFGAVDKDSWFSIFWNPIKSSKSYYTTNSFISFYSFQLNTEVKIDNKNERNFKNISLKGIIPTKFDKSLFCDSTSKIKYFFYILLNYSCNN